MRVQQSLGIVLGIVAVGSVAGIAWSDNAPVVKAPTAPRPHAVRRTADRAPQSVLQEKAVSRVSNPSSALNAIANASFEKRYCDNSVMQVFRCRGSDPSTCEIELTVPCFPYRCASSYKACKTSCISDIECSAGATCDTVAGWCAPYNPVCADDFTIENSNGQLQSCSPYRCQAGQCLPWCMGPNDCTSGYTCNKSTQRCVEK